MLNVIYHNIRLAWIEAIHVTCQWDNLNPIEQPIGNVITDNDCRALFLDLTTG